MDFFLFSMEGGELFERIQNRGDHPFTERGKLCVGNEYTKLVFDTQKKQKNMCRVLFCVCLCLFSVPYFKFFNKISCFT